MRVSARCLVRAAVLSFLFSVILLVLLAVMSNGLAAAEVGIRVVQVIGFVVALLARTYAAVIGARSARREHLDRREVILSATVGLAIGYVAIQLANAFTEVAVLGRQLSFGWDMLYGILPWLLAGVLGGWLATRPRKARRKRRRTAAAETD